MTQVPCMPTDNYTRNFKKWLDRNRIKPEKAALIFGKSKGTIHNYRSKGVPANDGLRSSIDKAREDYDEKMLVDDGRIELIEKAEELKKAAENFLA